MVYRLASSGRRCFVARSVVDSRCQEYQLQLCRLYPYESTESFDIKGLTYNNSGNVQIEVTCERPGYLPQKKRFNLRQVIDQKEISAQFNLVKESTGTDEE